MQLLGRKRERRKKYGSGYCLESIWTKRHRRMEREMESVMMKEENESETIETSCFHRKLREKATFVVPCSLVIRLTKHKRHPLFAAFPPLFCPQGCNQKSSD